MYRKLADETLKTGEKIEVGVVLVPDEQYGEMARGFLSHKSSLYQKHMEQALKGELGELETRFYLGLLGGQPITNIMTVEYDGVGVLGHVFTKPEHRRKGACRAVMSNQMEDFRRRNGKALYLGTGYDTHPYHIYQSYGFRGIVDGAGFMRYCYEEDFDAKQFAPCEPKLRDIEWRDWGPLTALLGITEGSVLRNLTYGVLWAENFEGGFMRVMDDVEKGETVMARVLQGVRPCSVVGFATLSQDRRWGTGLWTLDLFVHPNFESSAGMLIADLPNVEGKIQANVDANDIARIDALKAAQFHQEAVLKQQVSKYGKTVDIAVLSRTS